MKEILNNFLKKVIYVYGKQYPEISDIPELKFS